MDDFSLAQAEPVEEEPAVVVAERPISRRLHNATIAPHAGLRLDGDRPESAQFKGISGSFSLVAETPTEHVHMAFGAPDDAAVGAFHRAGVRAGYRDNGAPAERVEYPPGYYVAFLLDPDGNNIELVRHHRE